MQTYSGLFLVAVNPYNKLPIYTEDIVKLYRNKKRGEVPPHIYAVTDAAYRAMLQNRESQSLLITGESGAGKTENTKKVIHYLASIAGDSLSKNSTSLEKQIILANPILESFGNAQTIRNNNSSRFGKFIRIEFTSSGAISGANIEHYLLEKSRVTHQTPKERNYHIFYQLLKGASQQLKQALLLEGTLNDYAFVQHSNKNIDGVDDVADFKILEESMEVMGFSKQEQFDFFRIVAAILLLGNLKITEDRNGQAQLADTQAAEKACFLLGISLNDFSKGLLRPIIKAGKDWVTQSRDLAQVTFSIEALSRSLYERMFSQLVARINAALDKPSHRHSFIGVLDIAGFEIFDKNSFEQLCINYTNEKLQQFFNHRMFIMEQEEYRNEGIEWNFIDFGLDLQPTIDLIEKTNPIGILSLLDEDSVMPKATDKTFTEKLNGIWKGKSLKYDVPRFQTGFILGHYAGKVEYNTEGWLDKNKDPLNDNLTKLLAQSSVPFVQKLFEDYSGSEDDINSRIKGKKGQFRTVAQKHKEQLSSLMNQLNATHPHFVRCIVPNDEKKFGKIQAKLVQDQLRCNGVLEGIRICRQGFPNRLSFHDFRQRYEILAKTEFPRGFMDGRKAALQILEELQLESSQFRVGQTKVFFKAGTLGQLEDQRDAKLSKIFESFSCFCKGFLQRKKCKKQLNHLKAIRIIQKNARIYIHLKEWSWWRLYSKLKPLLNVTRIDEELKLKTEVIEDLELNLAKQKQELQVTVELKFKVEAEMKRLEEALQKERLMNFEQAEVILRLREEMEAYERQIKDFKIEITLFTEKIESLEKLKQDKELALKNVSESLENLHKSFEKLEREKSVLEKMIESKEAELANSEKEKENLGMEKKLLERTKFDQSKDLELLTEKYSELLKEKVKLTESLAQVEHNLQSKMEYAAKMEKKASEFQDEMQLLQVNVVDANQILLKAKDTEITSLKQEIQNLLQQIEINEKERKELKVLLETAKEENSLILTLKKEKELLGQQLLRVKADLEEEQLSRSAVENQKKRLILDYQELSAKMEVEIDLKNEIMRKLNLKVAEFDAFKEKKEMEINEKTASLSKEKSVAEAQVNELKSKIESLEFNLATVEKIKARLVSENEDMTHEVEKLLGSIRNNEKSLKSTTNLLTEMQLKLEQELKSNELMQSSLKQLESVNASLVNDLSLKQTQLTTLQKNKEMIEEELNSLVSGRNLFDLEKEKKKIEQNVVNLEEQLLEETEAKKKLEIKLAELTGENAELLLEVKRKEEFLEETRKTLLKEINAMGEALDKESREKNEALREKRKIEAEVEHLMSNMDKGKLQTEKDKKKTEESVKELLLKLEQEEKAKRNLEEMAFRHEKKSNSLLNDIERMESQIDTLEKLKASLESRVEDLEDELKFKSKDFNEAKRKLEAEIEQISDMLDVERRSRNSMKQSSMKEEELSLQLTEVEESRKALLLQQKMNMQELDQKQKEIFLLEKQLKNQQTEMSELRHSLEVESKSKNLEVEARRKISMEMKELLVKLDAETLKSDELADSINLFRSKCQAAQSKAELMESMKERAERAEALLESKLQELQENFNSVQMQAKALLEEKAAMETENYQLKLNIDDLTIQIADLQSQKKQQRDLFEASKEKLENDLSSKESQLETLSKKYQREIGALTDQCDFERNFCVKLKDQIKVLESQNEDLKKQMDLERKAVLLAKKEKERLEVKLKESETNDSLMGEQFDALQAQVISLTNQLREAKSGLQDLEASKGALEKQKSSVEQIMAEVNAENMELSRNKQLFERKLATTNLELNELKERLTEEKEKIANLQMAISKSEAQIGSLTAELSKEKSNSSFLKNEKDSLLLKLQQALENSSDSKFAIDSCRKLESQIEFLNSRIEQEQKEKQELQKELRSTERLVKQNDYDAVEKQKSIANYQLEIARSEEKFKKLKSQLDNLELNGSELSMKNRKLERENQELRDRISSLEILKSRSSTPVHASQPSNLKQNGLVKTIGQINSAAEIEDSAAVSSPPPSATAEEI